MNNVELINTKPKEKLISLSGTTLTVAQFSNAIGSTSNYVERMIEEKLLLCFRRKDKRLCIPAWQEHHGATLGGLEEILLELSKSRRNGWSKLLFMITPNDYLIDELAHKVYIDEVTPVDALRHSYKKEVMTAFDVFER